MLHETEGDGKYMKITLMYTNYSEEYKYYLCDANSTKNQLITKMLGLTQTGQQNGYGLSKSIAQRKKNRTDER